MMLKLYERLLKKYLTHQKDENSNIDFMYVIKQNFLEYWDRVDKTTNGINMLVLKETYLIAGVSYQHIADRIGIHSKTLKRYRERFCKKLIELITEHNDILSKRETG